MRLLFCFFFISASPPERCQKSQHATGCFGGRERKGEAYFGHAYSLLRLHPQGAMKAILSCLLLLPCLLPPIFSPQTQFQFLCKWYMHVENTLKPSVRLLGSWINANTVSRCLSRGMEYKSARLILAPFKAPGRPHLEYGVQLWSLYYGKDIWGIRNRQGGTT